MKTVNPEAGKTISHIDELESTIYSALEIYSNVHRGSGHHSMVSTALYERAREIVLETLGLSKFKYTVIFCTPARADILINKLAARSYKCLSSQEIGLPIGVRALALKNGKLPKGTPFQSGGGSTRYVMPARVVWASAPDKFEAGTPAIINIIAFAKALLMIKQYGTGIFKNGNEINPADTNDFTKDNLTEVTRFLFNDNLQEYSGKPLMEKLNIELIGKGKTVSTMFGEVPFINLDNAASTPTFKPVLDAFFKTWRQPEEYRQFTIKEVKSICSDFVGAPEADFDVIFTSNTTEAINMVADSFKGNSEENSEQVILNTMLEHNSNDLPWRFIPRHSLIRIPVDMKGFIDLIELDNLLKAHNLENRFGSKRVRFVTVCGASNVQGVFNDLREISRIVHNYGAMLMVDGAQLIAHRQINMQEYGIDYLVFSAHKAYAPFGTGVLVARKGLMALGSEKMEMIRQSGEENTAGIGALGKALLLLKRIGWEEIMDKEKALTRLAINGLAKIPGIILYGIVDTESDEFKHKGGVISFGIKGSLLGKLASELTIRGGIGVRYGCLCTHLLIKKMLHIPPFAERIQAAILTLMPGFNLPGVMRISFGLENSIEEVENFLKVTNDIQTKSPIKNSIRTANETKQHIKEYAALTVDRIF